MTDTEQQQEAPEATSLIALLLGALLGLGLVRAASKALGLLVLAGIVLTTVVVLAVGVLVLRATLG